jgi:hemerythrin superfamily protein
MPDAITSLKQDHKEVKGLFREFEKMGDRATKSKREVVDKIVRELSIHAAIEEQVFYPAVRESVKDAVDDVLEALEEHHIVKWTCSELADMDPADERFQAKVTVLIGMVRHHIEEEEGELFPTVREALGRKRLLEIGDALETARQAAPTRPHPRLPDEPPANVLAGAPAAAADRMIDVFERKAPTGLLGRRKKPGIRG